MSVNFVIKNILTTAPYTIYQAGILATIVTGDPKYITFTVLCIIFGDGLNAVEKQISRKITSQAIGKRPGCKIANKDSWTGCGIYPIYGKKIHTWGMPSGHAQITSLAATFWSIYLIKNYQEKHDKSLTHVITSVILMWLLAICVWCQRIQSGCHTILQVCVGVIFGIVLGYLSYFIAASIFKNDMIQL